ncbi:MAG: helix-turn-helix domain-containing protein [Candidatus Acidiferrales bacterium]
MNDHRAETLVTVKEAAQFLSVSVSTLYGWVWQRKIPFVKVGRALRFKMSALENFVQANTYEARAEAIVRANKPRFAYNTRAAGKG